MKLLIAFALIENYDNFTTMHKMCENIVLFQKWRILRI